MNYIAHLHLAHLSNTSLLGNFLGDFVKGSDLSHLPDEIAFGVRLHRKIDAFTDKNSELLPLKTLFKGASRRLASASLDVYFDFLLMQLQAREELNACLEDFYAELERDQLQVSGRYQRVKAGLLRDRWLNQYSKQETVLAVLKSIESRLGNKIRFAEASFATMQKHHNELEKAFLNFYPNLINVTKQLANAAT